VEPELVLENLVISIQYCNQPLSTYFIIEQRQRTRAPAKNVHKDAKGKIHQKYKKSILRTLNIFYSFYLLPLNIVFLKELPLNIVSFLSPGKGLNQGHSSKIAK